jgi:methylglutaconyl-CoA hydratase
MKDLPVEKIEIEGSTIRVESLPLGVKRLVLARPRVRNAFDEATMAEIKDALGRLASDYEPEQMRLLVFTGEGKVFSAGADVGYMRRLAERGEDESLDDARSLASLFYRLAEFPAPVVGAVRGAAFGGAFGLTVCMDYVLAEAQAVFATTEVRLGIVPAVISPYVVRRLGLANAASLMLSGRQIHAPEAVQLGLVQRTVAPELFDEVLQDVILDFLHAGPHAARRTKALLRKACPLPSSELVDFTAGHIARARCSEEGQAGLQAFFEKVAPPWAAPVRELQERRGGRQREEP